MTSTPLNDIPAAQPLAQQTVRGGVWVALSSYFNIGFGFVANLILARLLTPGDFGIVSLATFFFALINLRPKLGLDTAFAQRAETNGILIQTHFISSFLAALLSLALALPIAALLPRFGYEAQIGWVLIGLAAIGISDALMSTAWVLLDKHLQFGHSSLWLSLSLPLSYLPAFYLALNGGGPWSLVAQMATYALFLLAGLWVICYRQLRPLWNMTWSFNTRVLRDLLRLGVWVGAGTAASTLLYQYDNFLVGSLVGVTTLGYYDRAYRLAQWPHVLISSNIARTAFFAYARLRDEPARLAKSLEMTIWLVTRLALSLALAIFVAAPDLIVVLLGERWLPSAPLLRILVLYSVMRPLLESAGVFLVAIGQPQRWNQLILWQALTLIAVATPLTVAWGAVGTALGVGVAFVLGLAISQRYLQQTLSNSAWRQPLTAPLIASLATLALYALISQWVEWNDLPIVVRAGLKFLYGGLGYGLLVWLLEPQASLKRVRYLWALLTQKEASNHAAQS